METETKFLDQNYVETRVRELKEVRTRKVAYKIEKSNRENSNSLYVRFYVIRMFKGEEKFYGVSGLRISDHLLTNYPETHKQFIIDPTMPLTKGRKAIFMRTLDRAVKVSLKGSFLGELNKLSKNNRKADQKATIE